MAYIADRVVHDADAHIMEPPNWLRDHADPDIRDRIERPGYANELVQTGDGDQYATSIGDQDRIDAEALVALERDRAEGVEQVERAPEAPGAPGDALPADAQITPRFS